MNMDRNKKAKLLSKIFLCKQQLKSLSPKIETSKVTNDLYNKILIEKAICEKKLKEKKENYFLKNIKKLFNPQKRLICDYFQGN